MEQQIKSERQNQEYGHECQVEDFIHLFIHSTKKILTTYSVPSTVPYTVSVVYGLGKN